MPNHVTTILRAEREVIHALHTEEGVDFNRIIPMPPDVIRGGVGMAKIDGEMVKVYYPETNDPDDPMGLKRKPIPYPEGATDWYDWSIKNWGTKWNAYDHEISEEDTVVRFDTAWAHPYPVVTKLSEMFPEQVIAVIYADEDLGNNFGAYLIQNGDIGELPMPPDGSEAAREMAALIKYGQHYADLYSEDEVEDPQHFSPVQVLGHALHGPKE